MPGTADLAETRPVQLVMIALFYGMPITAERLLQTEKAQRLVQKYCSSQVMVRYQRDIARIEVEPDCMSLFI